MRRTILILAITAGLLLRVALFMGLPRALSVCTTDFSALYAGGRLAGSLEMYSPRAVFAAEEAAMGCHLDNLIFIRPPFYALLMKPLAQLPFVTALWMWRAIGLAAIGVFLWLWPSDRWGAAAACAWFVPLATNFTVGQDVAIVLALAVGACRLSQARHPWWAGVLLGLCVIKFHLFLLLPLLLWHRKLWRTAWGACATAAALACAAFVAYGAAWPARYLAALGDSRLNPYPRNMANLNGLFHYHGIWMLAAVAVAALCWYAIARGPLELGIASVLAGGVLIAPHTTISDGVLFLPLLLLASRERLVWPLAVFALGPFYAFLPSGTLQVLVVACWRGWRGWCGRRDQEPSPPVRTPAASSHMARRRGQTPGSILHTG